MLDCIHADSPIWILLHTCQSLAGVFFQAGSGVFIRGDWVCRKFCIVTVALVVLLVNRGLQLMWGTKTCKPCKFDVSARLILSTQSINKAKKQKKDGTGRIKENVDRFSIAGIWRKKYHSLCSTTALVNNLSLGAASESPAWSQARWVPIQFRRRGQRGEQGKER